MKKALILSGIAVASFFFTGCGTNEPIGTSGSGISTENTLPPATESVNSTTEPTEAEPLSAVIENIYGISITTKEEHQSFMADDNTTCVLDATASYPILSIEGAPEVSEKINAVITAEVENFWKFETGNVTYAKEDFNAAAESLEYSFEPYTASFSYSVKRCDDKIISLVISQYDYTGGAHGNPWSYGVTFDTATGERLQLAALSENGTDFYHMLLNNITEQSSLAVYQVYIFQDFALEIENSLLKDSTIWYFDNSGISFISNPYVLGSYAAGTFEFNIPYESLTGLKSAYQYQGKYMQKIFPGIPATHDINGDGAPDTICYSVPSYTDDPNGSVTLIINDTDLTKQLEHIPLDYPWTGAYYLTDIDTDDGYVEIAIMNDSYDEGTCTHFFRYTDKGDLTYLGNVPGLYSRGLDVHYNANGNLVLFDPVTNAPIDNQYY